MANDNLKLMIDAVVNTLKIDGAMKKFRAENSKLNIEISTQNLTKQLQDVKTKLKDAFKNLSPDMAQQAKDLRNKINKDVGSIASPKSRWGTEAVAGGLSRIKENTKALEDLLNKQKQIDLEKQNALNKQKSQLQEIEVKNAENAETERQRIKDIENTRANAQRNELARIQKKAEAQQEASRKLSEKYCENIEKEIKRDKNIENDRANATRNYIDQQTKLGNAAAQKAKVFMAGTGNYAPTDSLSDAKRKAEAIIRINNSMANMSPDNMFKANAKIKTLSGEMDVLGKSFKKTTTESDNFIQKLGASAKQFVYYQIAIRGMYEALNQLRLGIQYIKDLDKEMTSIQLVTGQSDESLNTLAKSYNTLGKEMGVSTLEVAKGSLEFIRQGKTAEETATLIKNSTQLSKLANMDAAASSEALTSIMNGFKMEAEETTQVVDKLVKYLPKHMVTYGYNNYCINLCFMV